MPAFILHQTNPMRKILATAICLVILISVKAQTPGLGTWNLVNIGADLKKNWTGFFEAQIRSQQFYNHFHYHEFKGGFGYNVAQHFNITLLAGQYVTYTFDDNLEKVTSSEFRFTQQFTIKNRIGRVKLENRYRAEQRWTSAEYRNRFRYRLQAVIPINKKDTDKGAFYLNTSNEIFLTNRAPHFERNRLYGGVGYVFSDLFSLQTGIMNQYDYSRSGTRTHKNYFHLSLLFDIVVD